MVASKRGLLAGLCRWVSILAMLGAVPGCGSDHPPDTGGGTIRGTLTFDCAERESLENPWVTVIASYELSLDEVIFQSLYAVPVKTVPEDGIQYELRGLSPDTDYYVYAAVQDYAYEQWWTYFCIGIYNFPNKVMVSNTAAVTGIDFTVSDLP